MKDGAATAAKLGAKRIDVGMSARRMRVSPSIYNTAAGVEAVLTSLA